MNARENVLAAVDHCEREGSHTDSGTVTSRTLPHLPRHRVIAILGSLRSLGLVDHDENHDWTLTAEGAQEVTKKASS